MGKTISGYLPLFIMKVSYSVKPILSRELLLFVVAGHIESSNAGYLYNSVDRRCNHD